MSHISKSIQPTYIQPNAASTLAGSLEDRIKDDVYNKIEQALIGSINKILNIEVIDKDQKIDINYLDSIELLVILEEQFPNILLDRQGKTIMDDDKFSLCITVNEMMQVIKDSK